MPRRSSKLPPKSDLLSGKPLKKHDLLIRMMNAVSTIPDDQGQYDGLTGKEKLKMKRKKRKKMT